MHVLKVEMNFFFDEKCFNESERADYAHKRSRLVEDARGRTLYSFPIKREELTRHSAMRGELEVGWQ